MQSKNEIIQSVLFDKNKFTVAQANSWLKSHNLKNIKTDITANFIRKRQHAPEALKRAGYSSFKNKTLPGGIELVIAFNHSNNT